MSTTIWNQMKVLLPIEGQQYNVEVDCLHMGMPAGTKLCPLCQDTNGKLVMKLSRVSVAGPVVLKK